MISGVYNGGPGQKANMRRGDIIKKVNDKKVDKKGDIKPIYVFFLYKSILTSVCLNIWTMSE